MLWQLVRKKAQCRKQKEDQGSKPSAGTVQASCNSESGGSEDSFWIFAVIAPSGRNARILVDSGADKHVCPTNFASATPLGPVKGGMLFDAQGHMISAHGTRTLYMRVGPEGQSVGAEFRVRNVRTPILRKGKLVKQGNRFEAGPTSCKMSKGDRSVTLDVVKHSLSGWTRLKELAMLMQDLLQQLRMGYLKNYGQAQARRHTKL